MKIIAARAFIRLALIGLAAGIAAALTLTFAARNALADEGAKIIRQVVETPAGTHVCLIFKSEPMKLPMGSVNYDYEVLGCWPQLTSPSQEEKKK